MESRPSKVGWCRLRLRDITACDRAQSGGKAIKWTREHGVAGPARNGLSVLEQGLAEVIMTRGTLRHDTALAQNRPDNVPDSSEESEWVINPPHMAGVHPWHRLNTCFSLDCPSFRIHTAHPPTPRLTTSR